MHTPPAALFKTLAFVMIPVKDVKIARDFYEGILGLKVTASWEDKWIEYDIGEGTLAITPADEKHRAGVQGATVAVEVSDLAAILEYLKVKSVRIAMEPFDTPVCRGCIIADPDGNEIMLHHKK